MGSLNDRVTTAFSLTGGTFGTHARIEFLAATGPPNAVYDE
jgi:hypothetical protein